MSASVKLVILSFFASFFLAMVSRIEKKYLIYAGLGGAITRCVYLLLLRCTNESFIYSFLAAMAAALYAEFMAVHTRRPSTVFLYPSIIPLVPDGLLYYTVVGVLLKDTEQATTNGVQMIHSLVGLGIGFTIVSMVMHYKRNYQHLRRLDTLGRMITKTIIKK